MKAILNRRSIRKYTQEPVPDGVIKELLEAAMSAPSAGNEQPWEFVVINDRQILNEIPKFHPYSQMLKEAPVAILVCGDLNQQKYDGYWVLDCAAATENILIAAQDKGLGAVWLGIYPAEERIEGMRKLLGIPDHVVPVALIALGYPAEHKEPANRFNPNKIRYNKW
ncbi:MAG TPA: nitroreductase family protein [Clostridia bacterium]|nr:nitroreductase family protein [Clostridia bacterium]